MKSGPCPKIEIIAVGTELLRPQFFDTNSVFIISRLAEWGLETSFRTIVGDEEETLKAALECAQKRADIIFTIGGLGPTSDDRTRNVVGAAVNRKLVFHEKIIKNIEARFRFRGLDMPKVNERQAEVIEGAEVLDNAKGTAPGLWLDVSSSLFILLPGPPHELEAMFEESVFPRLKKFQCGFGEISVLKITGLSESMVESRLTGVYSNDPDIRITTLAHPGQIEIHLFCRSEESREKAVSKIRPLIDIIKKNLEPHIFSDDGKELEEVAAQLLLKRGLKLAVAESCTGGLLSHRLTNVPGSSGYFLAGITAYSNDAKTGLLDVPTSTIERYGAVSSETAKKMAEGVRIRYGADLGLSVTGIAGPGGGTVQKPVGLVYTGLSWKSNTEVSENRFLGNRDTVKFQSSQKALDMLRRQLLQQQIEPEYLEGKP